MLKVVLLHNHNVVEYLLDRGGLTALSSLWMVSGWSKQHRPLLDPTLGLRGPGSRSNGEMMEMYSRSADPAGARAVGSRSWAGQV